MKITSVAATFTGAIVLAGFPILALAQDTAPSPIQLDRVQVERSYGFEHQLFPGLITVDFTNTAPVAVAEVDFDLEHEDGTYIDTIQDVGPFSPGETMKHSFTDIHISKGQKLVIDSVTFADGTKWTAPNDQPPIGKVQILPAE